MCAPATLWCPRESNPDFLLGAARPLPPSADTGRAGSDQRQHGSCLASGARCSQDNHDARLGPGGSVTELSVTGRCRSGSVIKQPCNLRTSNAVPFCSLSKVNDLGLKSDHQATNSPGATGDARRGHLGKRRGGPCDVSAASGSHPVGTRCPLLLTFPTCQAGAEVWFAMRCSLLWSMRRVLRADSCAFLLQSRSLFNSHN